MQSDVQHKIASGVMVGKKKTKESERWGGMRSGAGRPVRTWDPFTITVPPSATPSGLPAGEDPLPILRRLPIWSVIGHFVPMRQAQVLAYRGLPAVQYDAQVDRARAYLDSQNAAVVLFAGRLVVAFSTDGTTAAVMDIRETE